MSRDIALNIAINAGQAVSEAERLRAELEATEQAVEGLSATEITARGFSDAAAEIEGMRRAAEALGEALGPELSSKVGAGGFASLIAEARAAGASFDEIIADADRLAGGVRELNDAMGSVDAGGIPSIAPAADTAVGGVRRVTDEAGRSRQAIGQIGGEAVQQFGSMLGPLQGVSYELGNVAQQGLSGTAGLGAMAATAGPLIGVGLAVGIIGNELQKNAARKAFDRETVDSYKEAISGAGDEVTDFVTRLTDAGKVTSALGTGQDITGALTAAGVGISEYTQLVMGGVAAVDEWAAANFGATDSVLIMSTAGEEAGLAFAGMREEAELFAQGQEELKAQTEFFLGSSGDLDLLAESYVKLKDPISQLPDEFARIGEAINSGVTPSADDLRRVTTELGISIPAAFDLGTEAADRQKSSLENLIGLTGQLRESQVAAAEAAVAAAGELRDSGLAGVEAAVEFARDGAAAAADRHAEATQREADALRDNVTALDEQVSAQRGAVDAGYALADSQDAFARATVTATQALNDGTPGEQAAAYRDLAQSAQLVADNTVRVAEETATAKGQSLSRSQSIDIENGALLAQAGTLNGPMRAALVEHIGRINGIPPKKISQIQALIDQGKIGEAEGLLAKTSRTRDAAIKATVNEKDAEKKLNQTARERRATFLGDADTQLAEQKLARTAAARRTAKIGSDADTQLAEQKLARTAAARRTAKIFSDADTQLAEQKLGRTAAAQRTATIDSDADVSNALSIIQGAADASYNATITATARDNASGALDAIANVARFAYITSIVSNVVERT